MISYSSWWHGMAVICVNKAHSVFFSSSLSQNIHRWELRFVVCFTFHFFLSCSVALRNSLFSFSSVSSFYTQDQCFFLLFTSLLNWDTINYKLAVFTLICLFALEWKWKIVKMWKYKTKQNAKKRHDGVHHTHTHIDICNWLCRYLIACIN